MFPEHTHIYGSPRLSFVLPPERQAQDDVFRIIRFLSCLFLLFPVFSPLSSFLTSWLSVTCLSPSRVVLARQIPGRQKAHFTRFSLLSGSILVTDVLALPYDSVQYVATRPEAIQCTEARERETRKVRRKCRVITFYSVTHISSAEAKTSSLRQI